MSIYHSMAVSVSQAEHTKYEHSPHEITRIKQEAIKHFKYWLQKYIQSHKNLFIQDFRPGQCLMRLKYPKLTTSKSLFELPGFQHKSLHGVEGSVLDCRPSDPGSNPSQCISLFLSFFSFVLFTKDTYILLVKATA